MIVFLQGARMVLAIFGEDQSFVDVDSNTNYTWFWNSFM